MEGRQYLTNPISIAASSNKKYPYVLDMATSVVAIGKIKVFEKKDEKIPMGWGMDDNGNVTDDSKKIQSRGPGALLASWFHRCIKIV